MQILFNHLHKTGGSTVCHHLAERYPNHFQTDPENPNRSLREFAKLPEKTRHGFDCVMGHSAIELLPFCRPRITTVTVVRDPIERLISLYQFLRDHPNLHYHPLAKAYSLGRCCELIDQFQNYYARWLKLDRMRYVFLSPRHLLEAFGIDGPIERLNTSRSVEVSEKDIEIATERNAEDLKIWGTIIQGAKAGRFSPATIANPKTSKPKISKPVQIAKPKPVESPPPGRRSPLWLSHIREAKPMPSGTLLVTTHFNPASHARMIETYREWDDTIGYEHVVYEANRKQEIAGSVFFQSNERQNIFQKERLINLAVEQNNLAEIIAWVDRDIIFDDDCWLERAVDMIRSGFDAVQLFESIEDLGPDWEPEYKTESGTKTLSDGRYVREWPGGAWIASRAYLERIGGLYDRNPVGGGDLPFFTVATGGKMPGYLDRQPPKMRKRYKEWFFIAPRAKWGYLPGVGKHIWHGPRANREYAERDHLLSRYGYDPDRHVRIGENGLIEWTDEAPEGLPRELFDHFVRRADG